MYGIGSDSEHSVSDLMDYGGPSVSHSLISPVSRHPPVLFILS